MSFPNTYTHRKVAESSAKSCEICYRPSTSVLVTPENKVGHTCSAIIISRKNSAPNKKHRLTHPTAGLLLRLPRPSKGHRLLHAQD
ncbi:hypothetical protein B0T19DRAFT_434873 [Cercophora scortea]|uniref:Uncharacterized protein n=1 Tax=Cercophora scortea TaxID=314031 RepID=A0AAE0I4F4_9PEZI|nr:hypothetical protein B0T19DRAFT_434873 [Cercophora scortea]